MGNRGIRSLVFWQIRLGNRQKDRGFVSESGKVERECEEMVKELEPREHRRMVW